MTSVLQKRTVRAAAHTAFRCAASTTAGCILWKSTSARRSRTLKPLHTKKCAMTDHADRLAQILEKLSEHITTAYEIRRTVSDHDMPDDPEGLYEWLKRVRAAQDRVEFLLADVLLIRSRVERLKGLTAAEVEDAEIANTGRANDYTSARDRGIEINTKTLTQRKAHRTTTDAMIEAQAAVEIVRTYHRGIDGTRRDIDTRLRAITVISSLER